MAEYVEDPMPLSTAQLDRRRFLAAGVGSLSLPGLLELRAAQKAAKKRTALILLFCYGGLSHIDTYDPKPEAPAEFRGPFAPIRTRSTGMTISELLPRHANLSDKFCLLRSLAHQGACHANGPQHLMAGHFTPRQNFYPEHPDCLSIANYLRWESGRSIPNYIGMTTYGLEPGPVPALGPAYLGGKYAPFAVMGDPNRPKARVGGLLDEDSDGRIRQRHQLVANLAREPQGPSANLMSEFQQQAIDILSSPQARHAFDLDSEPPGLRDRYGRTSWGQHCLLARKLVEAGVDLVTVTLAGSEAGGAGANWDDHAVNCDIFETLKKRSLNFDRCVSALIEDLYDRGLDKRVLVVVTGEFGRTPRISHAVGSTTKVNQPGRDHWPSAMSILFAGGGIAGGQVIGATDRLGQEPARGRVGPWDFIATIYRHLGIDAKSTFVPDTTRRPVAILGDGEPIRELVGSK
jgi:hypothetical protein